MSRRVRDAETIRKPAWRPSSSTFTCTPKEPVGESLRSEAKEPGPDARPQARKIPEAYPLRYVEAFFGPRTPQMALDHSPQ